MSDRGYWWQMSHPPDTHGSSRPMRLHAPNGRSQPNQRQHQQKQMVDQAMKLDPPTSSMTPNTKA